MPQKPQFSSPFVYGLTTAVVFTSYAAIKPAMLAALPKWLVYTILLMICLVISIAFRWLLAALRRHHDASSDRSRKEMSDV